MIVRFHSEFTANLQDLWNTNVNQIREQNSHLNREALRKLREAWRLTVLSSAMPSDGDGEASFTDTLRPHADYGNRLNTDCLIRLVRLRQACRTHKTSNRQPVFLTPALL